MRLSAGIIFIALLRCHYLLAATCSYDSWVWDVVQKKSVSHSKVIKSSAQLSAEERGTVPGCTVCEQDQVEIRLDTLPVFKVCKILQAPVTRAIQQARADGFPLTSVVGYRVGKTKGAVNALGQRTQFSNHSYGTALDFNADSNGLYAACVEFNPLCRLVRGGEYYPTKRGAITRASSLYKAMRMAGFKWGGEIAGKQKDFMHFSLTGM
ncbi:MAG: M15 family metallopeptidase [Gammaproteobacteria bacterium]|nr:M15 family metallopeptidase [Gammaproteobacteria bacterium]